MSVVSVKAKSFILALFIRDDGERFLLGDNGYDFKDSQLHFAGNTIENDEVVKQGADGVILAGQVRRSAVQSFDGYIGDGTTPKETIEQMRRDFIAFFAKSHHFRVIYVDCNRNAWQRKGGYLVDAPEVKELWQIHPEYHVGLNFEDVNYYSYDEDAEGNEILANVIDVPVSTEVAGGLEWDEDGAVSEEATVEYDTETATATPAKNVYITDATEAPLASFRLDGETSQNGTPTPDAPVPVQTVTGENVVKIFGMNMVNFSSQAVSSSHNLNFTTGSNGSISWSGTPNTAWTNITSDFTVNLPAGDYTFSIDHVLTYRIYIHYVLQNGTNGDWILEPNNTSMTRNFGSGIKTVRLALSYMSVGTDYSDTVLPQLEFGTTPHSYEPYQGQSYEVNLGKNLFDKDNANILSAYIDSGQQTITSNNNNRIIWIKCEPSTTYTITKTPANYQRGIAYTKELPTSGVQTYGYYSGTNNWENLSFTTGADAKYLVIRIWVVGQDSASLDNMLASVQIEKGSQATSYAAYFEPIELCKIGDYQDYIYKSDGKWYVHKAVGNVVLDGTEFWGNGGVPNVQYTSGITDYATSGNSPFADSFAGVSNVAGAGAVLDDNTIAFINRNDVYRFYIKSSVASSVDAVKTWLSNNNLSVYYALATATNTEITNEALIAQLETLLNTARTYAGVNNIFTVTPNEQGTLEISYYTKYRPIVTEGGYVWEAGGTGGTTTVVNDSIGSVNPIWKVYGPTTNPVLENITTGEQIEYIGTIGNGQTLTIDMGEQTASLDGLNVISNVIGDYISLASGANTLVYSVTGEAGASELGWSEIVG